MYHVGSLILYSKRAGKVIRFFYIKMVIFGNILRKNQIIIYPKRINFKVFSKEHTPEPISQTIYTLLKKLSAPLC